MSEITTISRVKAEGYDMAGEVMLVLEKPGVGGAAR